MKRPIGWLVLVSLAFVFGLLGCGGPGEGTKINVCLVKNRGANLDDKTFDDALKRVNELFKGSGVGLERVDTAEIDDTSVPEKPDHKGHTGTTPDQEKVIEAAKKKTKKGWKLLVLVVQNFALSNQFGKVNGVTGVGTGPVMIADPDGIGANTMGRGGLLRTLGHELGHALGLTHKKLKSDLTGEEKEGTAEYQPPNLMSGEGEKDDTQLTDDQKKALADGAKKYEK